MAHSHGGYFGDIQEQDFHHAASSENSLRHHPASGNSAPDIHSAALVRKMLELLEEQSTAAQRPRHGQLPDAAVIDPLSIAGSVGENPAAARGPAGHHAAQPWNQLLALGRKLLAQLEAGVKNPFEFLP